jgi:5-methylcytosine-specific restriction endonuclease McrA
MNDTNLAVARESSRHLADLLRREHVALADFLVALSEFDRAGAFRKLGYANVFDYLLRELKLSRGAAHYRKVAARLVARFPEVAEPLRDGRLCLSSLVPLAKVMTEANRAEVLPRFFHCSKQEAMQVAVEIVPAAVIPRKTVVTEIRPPVKSMTSPVHPGELSAPEPAAVPARDPARTVVEPLTSTMSRLHLTVSRVFVGKLRKARAGQSHVQHGAEDEQVLEAALDLLLAHQEKRRASVPPKVKREVRRRDEGKCQWALDGGGVCGSTTRLEIDHVVPRGRGGASTVENCRVLCDVHNGEAARQVYGDAHMDLFARNPVVGEDCAFYFVKGAGETLALPQHESTFLPASARPASSPGANRATAKRGAWAGSWRKLGSTAIQRRAAATSTHSCQTKRLPSQATPTTRRPSSPSSRAERR